MRDSVLLVDDEEKILNALERLLSDADVELLRAGSGEEGIRVLGDREVAVIVSDNLMPGMRGTEFLSRARSLQPDSVRILMTGYATLTTALEAINRGEVFRFLVKPWDNEEFLHAIADGLNRYRTVRTLRDGDEATLRSIAQTIELKDPYTRGHCDRVADYALRIGRALVLGPELLEEIRRGSWLHDCGKIGVPEAILNYQGPLGKEEFDIVMKHPGWGADVARQARLPRAIVNIVLYHHERWDGKGYPEGLAGERIPLEARIVSVADVHDALASDRPYRKGYPPEKVRGILSSMSGTHLDPRLVRIFFEQIEAEPEAASAAARPLSPGGPRA